MDGQADRRMDSQSVMCSWVLLKFLFLVLFYTYAQKNYTSIIFCCKKKPTWGIKKIKKTNFKLFLKNCWAHVTCWGVTNEQQTLPVWCSFFLGFFFPILCDKKKKFILCLFLYKFISNIFCFRYIPTTKYLRLQEILKKTFV